MDAFIFGVVIVVALWAAAIYLCLKTTILKDISTATNPPYSFSRAQLMWWTLIIVSCYILGFAHNEQLPAINSTCLALLGIGLGTTTFCRVIDNTQANQAAAAGTTTHQNETSQGFFTDLLSDETGISVHRFQAMLFNVIFGVSYFTDFFNLKYVFPTYDSQQLLLLGISSGAYIALKMNENGAKGSLNAAMQNNNTTPQPPANNIPPVTPTDTPVPPQT